ncbi:MAG TPA: GNAT family N-acetyltransferase [Candidatus Limnocylindrales bacterium]|jgi:RimJ/RimL family protein N-acetyltransferase
MSQAPEVTLRAATAADEQILLAWANDPVTRAAGFQPEPIPAADHRRWLADRLRSRSGRLLIGIAGDTPVGQVRLDRHADGRVEVGIAVAPEARGRGIGATLLALALDEARRDATLGPAAFIARIRPDNAASIALFAGAGFRRIGTTEVRGFPCLVYEADA